MSKMSIQQAIERIKKHIETLNYDLGLFGEYPEDSSEIEIILIKSTIQALQKAIEVMEESLKQKGHPDNFHDVADFYKEEPNIEVQNENN